MEKKSDEAGLKNSIYEQKTRSGRTLTRSRLLLYRSLTPLATGLIRLSWGWCRGWQVLGGEHIEAALAKAPSFIPVYWHQHQLICGKYLLDARSKGLKIGALVSPSVDGELGAMLARRLGGEVIRGSSTHTGARTLRDFYQALVHEGISPVITPDGPKGPPFKFKMGALLLAQLSQRPVIPLSFYASAAVKIAWDRFVIPLPGARVSLAVGEPVFVQKGMTAANIEALQLEMEQKLTGLFEAARDAIA